LAIGNSLLVFASSVVNFIFNIDSSYIATSMITLGTLACYWGMIRNLKSMRRANISKLKILALTKKILNNKKNFLLQKVCEVSTL
jgi:hypothetical protein